MSMEAIASLAGGSIGSSLGTAFGMSPDMMKMLGQAGDGAEGAMNAAMKGAQAGIGGSNVPKAELPRIDIAHILAVLQDQQKKGLGT